MPKLDDFEKDILKSVENDEWVSKDNLKQRIEELQKILDDDSQMITHDELWDKVHKHRVKASKIDKIFNKNKEDILDYFDISKIKMIN